MRLSQHLSILISQPIFNWHVFIFIRFVCRILDELINDVSFLKGPFDYYISRIPSRYVILN